MIKPIFIILTLAGFASGAEFEIPARLSVDGASVFRSSVAVVNASTQTPYSLAVGTSTNYSFSVSTGGAAQFSGTISRGTHTVLDDSMLDSFTLKFDTATGKIGLADRVEQNIMLDAFKIAVSSSLSKFNMVDGIMDEFEDESGVDTVASSCQTYNSAGSYYSPLVSIGGIDANTKLMLHFNSPINGSKEIQDSGYTGYIVSQAGNAALSTAQKKIGNCSLSLNGNSDYITVPAGEDWNFGTGNFTIDCWVRFNSVSATQGILSQKTDTTHFWGIYWYQPTSTFNFFSENGADNSGYFHCDWSPSSGLWYHIAVVRDGSLCHMFIDGEVKSVATETVWGTLPDCGGVLKIGREDGGGDSWTNGNIDELRVSKGIARWTTDFTPQTTPYASDGATKLLLHMESLDVSGDIPKIPAFAGTAHLDTAQKKFGAASILLNGSGSYVSLPDSSDWAFGTDNYTIDFWVRFNSVAAAQFFDQSPAGSWEKQLFYDGTNINLQFYVNPGGWTGGFYAYCPWTPLTGAWYHIALVRKGAGTGDTNIYINGVAQPLTVGAGGYAYTVQDLPSPFLIGVHFNDSMPLNGSLDEFRISKGIARWTANFTVPAGEYDPNPANLTYNMSLKSNATIAESTPSKARLVLFEEDVDTCALNTDITASVSRDNGTTYSTATLANEGDWAAGKRIISGVVDISTQPSGTNMKWRIDTSNNRDMKLHGVGLNWD